MNTHKEFIQKQRQKFNATYQFHDVFIQNGWQGKRPAPEPDDYVIPYSKYSKDNGETIFVTIEIDGESIRINDGENDRHCRDPFECYVHLVMNGNHLEAAKYIATNLIPELHNQNLNIPLVVPPTNREVDFDGSMQRLVPSGVYGSARWKTYEEVRATGLISQSGIPLGFIQNPYNGQLETISYSDDNHLITVARIGTGKNTAVQIPVLLQYDAPIFCIDPKGENALVTARYRKEVMGHDVVIINPFEIYKDKFDALGIKQVGFNPLASINANAEDFSTEVNAVCQLIIEPEGNIPFWTDAPRALLSCLIMFICLTKPQAECNLVEVKQLLMQDQSELSKTLRIIADNNFKMTVENANNFKVMAENAKSFLGYSKTVECVIFTAKILTNFLHDGFLSKSVSAYGDSNVDFGTLRRCEHRNVTVYLVVPVDKISNYEKWFRMVVHTALVVLRNEHERAANRVLVMVDECKAIGYLPALGNALAYGRGFGVQIWCFFQHYSQIQGVYPNPHEFLSSTGIQQFFTTHDLATAEFISNRIGNTTVLASSANYSPNGQIQSFSHNEVPQPFFSIHQIYGLDMNCQIIFKSGFSNPIWAIKNYYYNNPILNQRTDENPYAPKF